MPSSHPALFLCCTCHMVSAIKQTHLDCNTWTTGPPTDEMTHSHTPKQSHHPSNTHQTLLSSCAHDSLHGSVCDIDCVLSWSCQCYQAQQWSQITRREKGLQSQPHAQTDERGPTAVQQFDRFAHHATRQQANVEVNFHHRSTCHVPQKKSDRGITFVKETCRAFSTEPTLPGLENIDFSHRLHDAAAIPTFFTSSECVVLEGTEETKVHQSADLACQACTRQQSFNEVL